MVNWSKAGEHFQETIKNVTPNNWFSDTTKRIGTFILLFLSLSGGFTILLLSIGVNPTLVLSVLGAPIWILYVLLARKLTNMIMDNDKTIIVEHFTKPNVNTKEESSDKH